MTATVEQAQETLGGPRTRRNQEREVEQFGKQKYVRLDTISLAQLNSLCGSQRYGERRQPEPQAQPGDLRVDTVRQVDQPGGGGPARKGVDHIDAVDEVTQWQVATSGPRISEAYLAPVLEAVVRQFPLRILGFHSDNGSGSSTKRCPCW